MYMNVKLIGSDDPDIQNGGQGDFVQNEMKEYEIECTSYDDYCSTFDVSRQSYVGNSYYVLEIQINKTEFNNEAQELGELVFEYTANSVYFAIFEMGWKFVFTLVACFVTFSAFLIYMKFPYKTWIFEVKWTMILLISLVIQSSPIFVCQYLFGSIVPLFFMATGYAFYSTIFLMYILVIFEYYRFVCFQLINLSLYESCQFTNH